MITRHLSLFLLALSLSFATIAQCDYEPSSKVEKLLEQSKDKNYESDEQLEFLDKALEEEPGCLPCLMRLGKLKFLAAKRTNSSFSSAQTVYEKIIELCEDYHSEPYYYLGAMAYADTKYSEAEKYFDQFLRFPDSDPSKFEKDYDKKYAEVEEALVTLKKYKEIYEHDINYNPIKVAGVSSDVDDYLPCISPDGEVMFYTRKLLRKAKGDAIGREVEEMTWSKRPDMNQAFDSGERLPEPFNVGMLSYGGATISVDNKEFIFARKNPVPGNAENIDLFATRYECIAIENGKKSYIWTDPEHLGTNINTDKGWESQPSLSGDGKMLFFATIRPEVAREPNAVEVNWKSDIFVSKRQEDGTWGLAKGVGEIINTKGEEKAPFMHSDSRTLYFTSDTHFGVGGLDLFYSKMREDGSWSAPKNIGAPINTEQNEVGIIVSADGEVAYFGAKNFQKTAGYNVYSFEMPKHARPEKVLVLRGEVKDEMGMPASGASVELKYKTSGRIEMIKVNTDDGSYGAIINMEQPEDVVMAVKGQDVAFNSRLVVKDDEPENLAVVKVDVEVETLEANKTFILPDIIYSTNKSDIEESSKGILDEFASWLVENENLQIEILGHTDNVGDDNANKALSAERAFEVMRYLSEHGVEGKRMNYSGHGEAKPVASNDTEQGRAQNRRTEFVVKGM
ncbi:MAG: OmpA family protein [Flavobacteriales bacterium]|nr:OmpA family protein [Flavobacteriales bacterium]